MLTSQLGRRERWVQNTLSHHWVVTKEGGGSCVRRVAAAAAAGSAATAVSKSGGSSIGVGNELTCLLKISKKIL